MNKRSTTVLILHNIRSVYNVGAIFRTADAAGVSKIYLSGYTPTPLDRFGRKRKDLQKAALGAEETVAWEQVKDLSKLMKALKADKFELVALEQSAKSVDYRKYKARGKVALIVGNEVRGVSKQLLAKADTIIEIPMRGAKESLNVAVSTGIALYKIFE